MTAANLERRPAAELTAGDRIVLGDLLGCTDRHVVLFAYTYRLGEGRPEGVLLVHRTADDPTPQFDYLYARDSIAVERVLDETARASEDGDGTPVPAGVGGGPVGSGPHRHKDGA